VTGRAVVDSRETIGRVLSHVRCHVEVPHPAAESGARVTELTTGLSSILTTWSF
jgi:hypothetical protein